MCGIAGFVGFRNDDLIKQFSKWLIHRGPDGEGYFIDENATLLSRRLAIIDVKGGDQPIYNEDGSMVIVYNGEIYNYPELRKELEKKGHVFKTKSDTEVILHGYEEWGDVSFDRLNGMFAVAIHDKKKKRTVLARDHFGIKPLYFSKVISNIKTQNSQLRPRASMDEANLQLKSQNDIKIIFASEIKPLIYSGLIPVQSNDRNIYRYLKYRIHDDGRETFFKGVERLLPGEMMVIEESQNSNLKCQIKKYTDLEKRLSNYSNKWNLDNGDIEVFKKLLFDSIKRRLVSEVPVGTCLSGGLDSSTVVSVVNKLLQEKVGEARSVGDIQKTFSAVFPGSTNDEEKYIDNLKSQMSQLRPRASMGEANVKSYKVYPNSNDFFFDLSDFVKTQEEPTISTGPYAQYKVMEKAHEYVTVVLDGQGADEMMAGYLPYYFVFLKQLWSSKHYFKFAWECFSSLDIIYVQLINRLYILLGLKKTNNVNKIFNHEFNEKYRDEKFTVESNNIKKRLHEDIFKNSLQSLLRYEDKNAMRFSIEGRVPFLDSRLLEYIFSLPDEAIIKNGWNKYILRQSTKDLLPSLINQRRNKIGFTTPEYEWFKKESGKILDLFTGEQFEAKKFINQAEVVMHFQDFIAGKTDDTMFFWRVLNLELWLREFIVNVSNSKSQVPNNYQIPNSKKIKHEIKVEKNSYLRYPIRTEMFKKGDNLPEKIPLNINTSIKHLIKVNTKLTNKKWFVVVSEKIVATAQGRAHFIWDIKPSFWAKLLSRFVSRVPWGIGLGSPWTMQLAIEEVGLPRILLASVLGGLGRLGGARGVFYKIAGRSAAGIDGPTEYSLYPANVSAKLLPKNPQKVCEELDEEIKLKLQNSKFNSNSKLQISNYFGSAIIDANDIGRNVLGNTTKLSNKLIENIFSDNPMGQTNEQTPVTIVIKL